MNNGFYLNLKMGFLILSDLVMEYLMDKNLVSLSYSEDYKSVAESGIPSPTLDVVDFEDGLMFKF
jgi:hypothetical protein